MRFEIESIGDTEPLSIALEYLAQHINDGLIDDMLRAGAEVVVGGIRAQISSKAKNSTGILLSSIGYRLNKRWLTGRAYAVTFGWEKVKRRQTKGGKKIYTSDYGPILERAGRRTLKHMAQGLEDTRYQAEDEMITVVREAYNKSKIKGG